jgi:hypothetical protein
MKSICVLSDRRKKKQRWSIGPKSGGALPGLMFQADITYDKPAKSLWLLNLHDCDHCNIHRGRKRRVKGP